MAYPAGVSLASITTGSVTDFFGADAAITATVTPIIKGTTHIVHAATGAVLVPSPMVFTAGQGEGISFTVPHVDQDGWRDGAGNAYKGWAYRVVVAIKSRRGQDLSWTKNVAPVLGQALIDLDLVADGQIGIPISAPTPAVLSVNGQTGAVVVEAGANDGEIASLLQNDSSATGVALQTVLAAEEQRADASYAPILTSPVAAAVGDPVASLAVQVLGDSTGNEADEWVYLTAQRAAEVQPAFEVRHQVYDNENDRMPRPTVVRPAPNGERHIPMAGAAQSYPTYKGPAITGDLDARIRVQPNSWTTDQVLVGQFPDASANARSWYFTVTASGALAFQWSTDGTNVQTLASSGAWTPPATPVWLRVTLDVDNGAGQHVVTFYSSADGVTWTQVGVTTTRTGTTSLFGSTAPYQIGGRGTGAGSFNGKIFELEVRAGIGDTFPTVTPCLPEHWAATPSTPSPAGSPILTFVNGSYPGANFAFLADTARLGKMTPNYGQRLIILSSSHNEGSAHGDALKAILQSYVTAVKGRLPDVPFGIATQNPRIAPANRVIEQAHRRLEYLSWGQAWGWTVFDTYGKFQADPRGVASLVDPDGFHPNVEGSRVWAAEMQRVLGIA